MTQNKYFQSLSTVLRNQKQLSVNPQGDQKVEDVYDKYMYICVSHCYTSDKTSSCGHAWGSQNLWSSLIRHLIQQEADMLQVQRDQYMWSACMGL